MNNPKTLQKQLGGALIGLLGLIAAAAGALLTLKLAGALITSNSFWRSSGLNPAIGGILGLFTLAFGGITSLGIAGWSFGQMKKQ